MSLFVSHPDTVECTHVISLCVCVCAVPRPSVFLCVRTQLVKQFVPRGLQYSQHTHICCSCVCVCVRERDPLLLLPKQPPHVLLALPMTRSPKHTDVCECAPRGPTFKGTACCKLQSLHSNDGLFGFRLQEF